MKDIIDYLLILLMLSPLFFFMIAVGFRLLDNSGFLFLQKEIIINSSYVSIEILREQVNSTTDFKFKKKLKRVLLYRSLHKFFLILMIPAIPVTIFTYFALF
ncbi:MAG TPA: hypothetical protein VFM59_01790 [Salinimicrobium sp.]|nr:hypothetical protein [Salinimicrobium sp.]